MRGAGAEMGKDDRTVRRAGTGTAKPACPITTLVMIPEADEAAPLLEALRSRGLAQRDVKVGRVETACLDDLEAAIAVGGHGKVQLAVQTQHLVDQLPSVQNLVCAGGAGSLTGQARWGDVVVGSRSVEHDYRLRFAEEPPPAHPACERLVGEILRAGVSEDREYRLLCGPVASGDEDIMDRARALQIHERTGALCVAWEGAGAARAAAFGGLDFVEIRVITDVCDEDAAHRYRESLPFVMPHIAEVLFAWLTARFHRAGAAG